MKYWDIKPLNNFAGRTILVRQLGLAKVVYVKTSKNGGLK